MTVFHFKLLGTETSKQLSGSPEIQIDTVQKAAIAHFFLTFKFYFIFKLYIIVLVLPNIKMNPPQAYINLTNLIMLPMRLMIQRST